MNIHRRRSIRLEKYNYSSRGSYFVTLCVHNRACLFGKIIDGNMVLNEYGQIVQSAWHDLINHATNIELGNFVIMPNHFHGIIHILSDLAGLGPAPAGEKRHGLSEIIRQFKTFSARKINALRQLSEVAVWQRNYWERIIRDKEELERIHRYILDNPRTWKTDDNYREST